MHVQSGKVAPTPCERPKLDSTTEFTGIPKLRPPAQSRFSNQTSVLVLFHQTSERYSHSPRKAFHFGLASTRAGPAEAINVVIPQAARRTESANAG